MEDHLPSPWPQMEELFGDIIQPDDIIGQLNPTTMATASLMGKTTTSSSMMATLPLKDKKGRPQKASTTKAWDAIKAIPSGDNFKVLVQGTNAKTKDKFFVWDVNDKGIIRDHLYMASNGKNSLEIS